MQFLHNINDNSRISWVRIQQMLTKHRWASHAINAYLGRQVLQHIRNRQNMRSRAFNSYISTNSCMLQLSEDFEYPVWNESWSVAAVDWTLAMVVASSCKHSSATPQACTMYQRCSYLVVNNSKSRRCLSSNSETTSQNIFIVGWFSWYTIITWEHERNLSIYLMHTTAVMCMSSQIVNINRWRCATDQNLQIIL